jgi:epoxyqueuosine reductase
MSAREEISKKIKTHTLELGFDGCGISRAEKLDKETSLLQQWINAGYQADMKYMSVHYKKRIDIRELVPGAESVISVILNYNSLETGKVPEAPRISKYAWGRDYHKVMKKKLKTLLEYIDDTFGPVNGRYFVDSAPVLDRAWAARSGLGWIGKNTNLISRDFGSFIFIGELIIDKKLAYDQPINDYCGDCTKCIEACPTGAIVADKVIDSQKCISYQTIENKGDISAHMKGKMQNWIFGCDTCQDVCPWNQKGIQHRVPDFNPHPDLLSLSRKEWFELDDKRFNELFSGTPVMRAKYEGLKRNLEFLKRRG